MAFRLMPAGRFTPGPPEATKEDAPWLTGNPAAGIPFTFTKSFYMGVNEVRVQDYRAFIKATDRAEPQGELYSPKTQRWTSDFKPLEAEEWSSPHLPMACISFGDAVAFCEWLSKKEKRVYRLPTEVEWEYAARATSTKIFQQFENLDPTKINGALAKDTVIRANPGDADADAEEGFEDADEEEETDNALLPGEAGLESQDAYPPNAWGLYQMLGNLQEFVTMTRQPPESDIPFPGWTELPGKVNRMLRGGSFIHDARDCTVYQANFNCPPYTNCTIGFRVVLEMD
jgi:sulfatase modifying factor 1